MSAAASPAADGSNQDRDVQYRFCQDWCVLPFPLCMQVMYAYFSSANLLYPKENRATNELFYKCNACHRIENHNVSCTYRMQVNQTAAQTAGVTTDVANDPTVGVPSLCTLCGDQLVCTECGSDELDDSGVSDYSELEDLH